MPKTCSPVSHKILGDEVLVGFLGVVVIVILFTPAAVDAAVGIHRTRSSERFGGYRIHRFAMVA